VSDVSILRCANGVYTPNGGAISADCTATSPVSNIAYSTCAITRNNDGGSLDSLTLVAGAAPLNAASDLYLATATTVMHFMTASLVIDTIGSAFTHITAIGTDRSVGGSSVVIVGDAEGMSIAYMHASIELQGFTLKSTKGYLNLFRWRVLGCIASARSASAALLLPLVAPDFV
jgi:hypothetical protein